jgi:hypothetical protein
MTTAVTRQKISRQAQQLAKARGEEARDIALGFQTELFGGPFKGLLRAAEVMRGISSLSDATLAEVEQSEALFREFDEAAKPYKQLLDVYVVQHFGLKHADEFLRLYGAEVMDAPTEKLSPQYHQVLTETRALFEQKRFFHWDLEFPEVFIDLDKADWKTNPGFDAVVSNPPYVRQEELGAFKQYFAISFKNVYAGTADLFVYFFAQALTLLKEGGHTAYISSNSWLRANYASALRAYLRQETTVEILIDLGDNRVFEDAPDLYATIHIVRRAKPPTQHVAQVAVFKRGEGVDNLDQQLGEKLFAVSLHNQPDSGWQLERDTVRDLFLRLTTTSQSLEKVVNKRIFRGVLTGLNEAFIIDTATRDRLINEDPNCQAIIKPIVNGADVRSWYIDKQEQWLICTWHGTQIALYPPVKKWLQQFRESLEPRPTDWDQGAWKGRKPGSYHWYEIQDNVAYRDYFDGFKIFYPEMAKFPRFAIGEPGAVGNKTTFFIPQQNYYLLGVLMSRTTWFSIQNLCQPIGERTGLLRYTLSAQFISKLPIPDATSSEQKSIATLAEALTEQAHQRYQLHQDTRHRMLTDLGSLEKGLNKRLERWWELDFLAFRVEVQKAFKRDIPLKERGEWERYLADRRKQYEQKMAEIIRLETELNTLVYKLFNLTPDEIKIIEESTKYQYGEV